MAIDGIGGEIENILVVVAQVGSGVEVLGVFCEETLLIPSDLTVGVSIRSFSNLDTRRIG